MISKFPFGLHQIDKPKLNVKISNEDLFELQLEQIIKNQTMSYLNLKFNIQP